MALQDIQHVEDVGPRSTSTSSSTETEEMNGIMFVEEMCMEMDTSNLKSNSNTMMDSSDSSCKSPNPDASTMASTATTAESSSSSSSSSEGGSIGATTPNEEPVSSSTSVTSSSFYSHVEVATSVVESASGSKNSALTGASTDSINSPCSGFSSTSWTLSSTTTATATTTTRASKASSRTTTSLTMEVLPDSFHLSPEPLHTSHSPSHLHCHPPPAAGLHCHSPDHSHQFHLLQQIREDQVVTTISETDDLVVSRPQSMSPSSSSPSFATVSSSTIQPYFTPYYTCTKFVYAISERVFQQEDFVVATWLGFWALLNVTCANYVLTPMRDAVALKVGVEHIPKLTLASSLLAFVSSVPIGWLFEAPDPSRRKLWKRMGLTRGETQGTSLALFYRSFSLAVFSYAIGFQLVDWVQAGKLSWAVPSWFTTASELGEDSTHNNTMTHSIMALVWSWCPFILSKLGHAMYIAFFLVIHLMKLHSISLVWGVTTEAMEYEDVARKAQDQKHHRTVSPSKAKTRLQRLGMVSFGGTIGGIWGSVLASSMANILKVPGLLLVAAFLLEVSAELSIELGRIMQKHWEEQQLFKSTQDLAGLDASMKRSGSLGSMKRVASGNSLYAQNLKRVASGNSIAPSLSAKSLSDMDTTNKVKPVPLLDMTKATEQTVGPNVTIENDDTFTQRLLRGITTILKSRLLMAIFTYNALFSSTSVLLSFERAALVANRHENATSVSADTAFLANINIASSMAVFAMQASGVGAIIAQHCGPRGSLALMPAIRFMGVLSLAWWHKFSSGKAPNLILFLMLDECTRVVNLAIAKPVRESLWRGLSNEARYEAKPIVDTLANRWGAGSSSFCVSILSKILIWYGMEAGAGGPQIFGLPPVLFLCLTVSAWWTMVSLDLGQIRRRIDLELKKHQ